MVQVTLRNTNRHHSVNLNSADHDSVTLPAASTHQVDEKFLWNIPPGVVVIHEGEVTSPIMYEKIRAQAKANAATTSTVPAVAPMNVVPPPATPLP